MKPPSAQRSSVNVLRPLSGHLDRELDGRRDGAGVDAPPECGLGERDEREDLQLARGAGLRKNRRGAHGSESNNRCGRRHIQADLDLGYEAEVQAVSGALYAKQQQIVGTARVMGTVQVDDRPEPAAAIRCGLATRLARAKSRS